MYLNQLKNEDIIDSNEVSVKKVVASTVTTPSHQGDGKPIPAFTSHEV